MNSQSLANSIMTGTLHWLQLPFWAYLLPPFSPQPSSCGPLPFLNTSVFFCPNSFGPEALFCLTYPLPSLSAIKSGKILTNAAGTVQPYNSYSILKAPVQASSLLGGFLVPLNLGPTLPCPDTSSQEELSNEFCGCLKWSTTEAEPETGLQRKCFLFALFGCPEKYKVSILSIKRESSSPHSNKYCDRAVQYLLLIYTGDNCCPNIC